MAGFSSAELELLVDLVRRHPALWDFREKSHRDNVKKAIAWRRIAGELAKPVPVCRSRWRSIRDYYHKQKKGGRVAPDGPKRTSSYWTRLGFLDINDDLSDPPSETDYKRTLDEIGEAKAVKTEAVDDEFTEFIFESCGSDLDPVSVLVVESNEGANPPRRGKSRDVRDAKPSQARQQEQDDRSRVSNRDNNSEGDDEIDLFFKTMAATVKKFRSDLKRQTKVKVFNIVSDMEALNESGR